MLLRLLSILGILVAASFMGAATILYPGGYDWNGDYISTLLRGLAGPARDLADAGVLLFCVSIALVFERLARALEFSRYSKFIRIAGIGSQVYAALTVTPMHDLMVTISFIFMLVAVLALIVALYFNRDIPFFAVGCVCLLVLVASAVVYYTGRYSSILPWAQRSWLTFFAFWLVCLDFRFPRARLGKTETA